MRLTAACSVLVLVISALAASQTAEQKTARYLDSIRKQPSLLLALLHDMPKGGDLHVHLTGAIYAEDMIDWAASDNFCIDRTTSRLLGPSCDPCERYTPKPAIRCAYGDHVLYNQIIDAWSMRNWRHRRRIRATTTSSLLSTSSFLPQSPTPAEASRNRHQPRR